VEAAPVAPVAVAEPGLLEPVPPSGASLVTADVATAEAQSEERRGRKRRRRRGRGGRGAEGEAVAGANGPVETNGLAEDDVDHVEEAPVAEPAPLVAEPAPTMAAAAVAAVEREPTHGGNGQFEAPREIAVRTPDMIVVPTTFSLPAVAPAPMPVEQLQAELQLAGLSLVQTEPSKLSETQARLAAEPRPVRVARERPQLPPLDERPLVQVETRPGQSPSA
jgi:ribonuclease E